MRALFRFDVDQMLDTLFINLNTSLRTHAIFSSDFQGKRMKETN